ncbi:DUF4238 domain-containing protein [Pontibacillus salicampi]|uniref:DUF4238 domain-containing protein n=1 Tax=Pontibacillus salicampi TaxID=1449801 RepID=A0ABV6LLK7_9BACI
MGQKGRQHYVPKFYLRNFSETDKSISTLSIDNSKYIGTASIKDMCQKNNFYGEDKVIENFLDVDIERQASKIIREIDETNKFPSPEHEPENYHHMVAFLLVSEGRNLKNANSTERMTDFVAKTMIKEHPDYKHLDTNSFDVKIKEPANQGIGIALESVPMVLDLKPLIIVHKTPRKFITSDNPLVRYNSFYIGRNYQDRGFGYITRGLQLFFPITPHKCILLYDSVAYNIPGAEEGALTLHRARDVDRLNELFYLNAYNNVFLNQRVKEDYIKKMHYKNRKTSKMGELDREIGSFTSTDSSDGKLIHISPNRVTKKITLDWIKDSETAKQLSLPPHMGGLQRTESPFIRDLLRKDKEKYKRNIHKVDSPQTFKR